ncbi:TetR/AcrR family transcriptional regulator [Frankia sp. Hr75.2]|nr:TetR/AcrR family transcriptional regulator [Frankia sp. Hr75.2]
MPTSTDSQVSKKPTRKRNSAKTRQAIVHAAGRRFATADYSRVTLQDIAEDVGITPALIVHYFGSKRRLLEEVSTDYAGYAPVLPDSTEGDDSLADRFAESLVRYWQDEDARWTVMALVRSLDVEGVADMFQREIRRRTLTPWNARITGDDADIRQRLLVGLTMGFGLFGIGILVDPEPRKLTGDEAARMTRYLSAMISICLDE